MNEKNSQIPALFLSPYDPAEHEDKIYAMWEKSGYFNPDKCIEAGVTHADAEPFTIVLPPPNVTGTLHMGHASMLATEDILMRYNRMKGKKALWIPGTDSAALATQSKVEGILYKKEKKRRDEIGREALMERIEEFVEDSKKTIINQTKKMGSSLDWDRYAFTMDDTRYKAVTEAFIRMYNDGLIYRGARSVNWDPAMQTTVSDDEVVYEETNSPFYYFKYGPFTIGTVRPETKFGDKYVVMHPDDDRYKEYEHGQQIEVEWINGPITATIIKDDAADPEIGTGVMTITPWHSTIDFEIAERHGLDKEQIINEKGCLLPIAGEFAGMHIKKARSAIVEKMQAKGLIERIEEDNINKVATNERGGGMIEPQIKEQWFIDVNKEFVMGPSAIPGVNEGETVTLKTLMQKAVSDSGVTIYPDRFERVYYNWINNLHDWCISRQIWYGHRIPAWFKDGAIKVQIDSPGEGWTQDPDTLDTWFSSGLWTMSTLGWPENTDDFRTYHPTSVLETGYDILFFWVARMILMSTYLVGQIPFKNVYLHGLVRDEKGKKMSKSLGNIIDPLEMIGKYGADATRLSLVVGAAPGNDMPLSEDKIKAYKKFANKLWNISRFVLTNVADADFEQVPELSTEDTKIIKNLHQAIDEVSANIDKFNLYLGAEKIYHYVWHELADIVLEESKEVLNGDDEKAKYARQYVLKECLVSSLKVLHPFMPFITETIWQELPDNVRDREILMVAKWPSH
ncbi:valine--tRNA ligase [bacterium]|nr:valine--tRNA ligase [bacterium]|tara:strand:+ start:1400 stop:3613 length:2214 start_codon:yes stop_codon:yes gene_type:complete